MNEEIENSYRINLFLVLLAVFILSFLTYRSVLCAFIVMLPSLIAQPLTEAVVYLSGIDMNINSLPVAAVGIGIGIDYGYYVLSRIVEEYGQCHDFDEANQRALMTTGRHLLYQNHTGSECGFVDFLSYAVSGGDGAAAESDSGVPRCGSVDFHSSGGVTAQAALRDHQGRTIGTGSCRQKDGNSGS